MRGRLVKVPVVDVNKPSEIMSRPRKTRIGLVQSTFRKVRVLCSYQGSSAIFCRAGWGYKFDCMSGVKLFWPYRDILTFKLALYLFGITVKASFGSEHKCMKKRKVVLYLTFHFQIGARDVFIFSWYPPVIV